MYTYIPRRSNNDKNACMCLIVYVGGSIFFVGGLYLRSSIYGFMVDVCMYVGRYVCRLLGMCAAVYECMYVYTCPNTDMEKMVVDHRVISK